MPLLRATLSDLPNGCICLSTAERQSLASKARRNDGIGKEKMGKKPDIMALEKCNGKLVEFLFAECSRVFCSATKKEEDEIKLWRELLDGSSYINSACRPIRNQFGVVGIQVAGERIYLNVLMNDTNDGAAVGFSSSSSANSLACLLWKGLLWFFGVLLE
ncbi:hypothetical protein F8M41_016227 [Gigaspora margarita]|uniref:Uncharacterized protein n=1 Tax=Gigaspora margarita TaxID=4874 RepID=A0A8H4APU0_GIGMA|nr:hypothetical protein F8M41_016227 [Gigaspora margarita]